MVTGALRVHPFPDVEEGENFLDIELPPFVWIEVLQVVLQCPRAHNEVIHPFAREAEHVQVSLAVGVRLALEEQVMKKVLT